jgi:hypothetical protein
LELTRPVDDVFSRCVGRKRDPLSTEGSRLFGGRFNLVGRPALHLAGSPAVAVAERLQLGEVLLQFQRFNPCLLVSVDVRLQEVLDLTGYPSRLERDSVCLAVFPENRRATSRIEVVGLDDYWPEG